MKRVLVCVINNWPYLHSYFVESFTNMMTYTKESESHTGIHCDFRFVWGAYVDVMRNQSVSLALRGQYDFLMMLDADMIYPKHSVIQSVNHDKDVVCGLYYWKTLKPYVNKPGGGYAPHAYKEYAETIFNDYPQWVSINVEKQEASLVPVEGLGGGGLCIKREVLEKVGRPQFECTWESTEISGEDLNFCRKAKKEGFKLYCDLSLKFGHITQSVVHDAKLVDLQKYASINRDSFPGMAEEDVVIKQSDISEKDLKEINKNIEKGKFAGTIKKLTVEDLKNGKTKNN